MSIMNSWVKEEVIPLGEGGADLEVVCPTGFSVGRCLQEGSLQYAEGTPMLG